MGIEDVIVSRYHINLNEVIYSLSSALDLVGVDHIHHGRRVAYMATECGQHLGWPKARLDDLFQASIMHDCGVSRTSVHAKLAQLEWEKEQAHCQRGAALLNSSPLLQRFAPMILHHHTHWRDLELLDLPDEVKLAANCIYMADRADILAYQYLVKDEILMGMSSIRETIAGKRGDWFAPELVDAFMAVSASEVFWFSLESNNVSGYVDTWLAGTESGSMDFEELRGLVSIFSYIVDAKSPFTVNHSQGVANLARYLGELFDLPEQSCELLELAGLLHDIGKLRVPDEILEKPGRLDQNEVIVMRRHSFDSYNILRTISGLEQVTQWAAQHHERVDGSGYPYHVTEGELSLEARIVEVADVFQALAQKRPYRGPMQPEEIMPVLKELAAEGSLDHGVVQMVEEHLQSCWRQAMDESNSVVSGLVDNSA